VAYTFEHIEARDPNIPALVASNASVVIFAPGDATKTPLVITDTTGSPLPNPVQVNAMGYGPAFISDLDRVAWEGGGFTGFFTSYEGMKEVAVASQVAAEDAKVTAAVSEAAASASQAAAEAAASAAAGAASGTAIREDPLNPGFFFVAAGGQLTPDPSNPGFFTVTGA
jgi:hypothetical protein